MKKIFILFAVSIFILSCTTKEKSDLQNPLVLKDGILYQDSTSTKPFTGRNKSKMLNMSIEYDVVNGIKEGDFIIYFPNKKIHMVGKMKENKNIGFWKYYNINGTLQTTGFFKDDKPDGIWIWYNQNGIKIEEGLLTLGKRNGEWRSYDSLGNLQIVKTFKDDLVLDSTNIN